MTAGLKLEFGTPPGIWSQYFRVVAARKPRYMPSDVHVPRIEATLAPMRPDPGQLQRYAEICGLARVDAVPIAYPHMLATGMHLAMLSSQAFPVSVLGVVHVQNHIEREHAQDPARPIALRSWLEGYRDTERGQEFDLETEGAVDGVVTWRETCTFLARTQRRTSARALVAERAREREREREAAADPTPVRVSRFTAPAGLGRRYASISGDYNPIHLGDLAARPFGFRRAIAHGMWSLARCAAELGETGAGGHTTLDVVFRTPVYLPSDLTLESRKSASGVSFALKDLGGRAHLTGDLRTASA